MFGIYALNNSGLHINNLIKAGLKAYHILIWKPSYLAFLTLANKVLMLVILL
jgi:hypothetical protein